MVAGSTRSIRSEFIEQGFQVWLDIVPVHCRRTAGADFRKGKQDQQRLMHGAPVALLPDAHAVESLEDFVARHAQ